MNIPVLSIVTMNLLALLLCSDVSRACSVPHVSGPEQITDGADTILLVRVPEVELSRDDSPLDMVVLEVLKGRFEAKVFRTHGQTTSYSGPNDRPVPYERVRPGGLSGVCYATDYKPGGQFLLFLSRGELYWAPLSPTNEEVTGSTDPWVVWVRNRLVSVPVPSTKE